jgi:hypothetical protein
LWYFGFAAGAGASGKPRNDSWEGKGRAREREVAGSCRRGKETKVRLEVGWRRGYGCDVETAAAAEVAAAMAMVVVMVPAGEEGWDVCKRP